MSIFFKEPRRKSRPIDIVIERSEQGACLPRHGHDYLSKNQPLQVERCTAILDKAKLVATSPSSLSAVIV
jgi:hypothetical protein